MTRDNFALTRAASGTTLNDGDAIGAAIREQHRLGVQPPGRGPRCAPWSAREEIGRKKRLTRRT